jgi:hypothetical protein
MYAMLFYSQQRRAREMASQMFFLNPINSRAEPFLQPEHCGTEYVLEDECDDNMSTYY